MVCFQEKQAIKGSGSIFSTSGKVEVLGVNVRNFTVCHQIAQLEVTFINYLHKKKRGWK